MVCHGVTDVRTGEPVTRESAFQVGSLAKSMVATVVCHLAASGRVSLEDPVARHVPELKTAGWAQQATVRDLMANRSGLPLRHALEFGFAEPRFGGAQGSVRMMSELAEAVPVLASGRTRTLAGVSSPVVETVTGLTWSRAMRDGLAEARLTSTAFVLADAAGPPASGHDITASGPVPVPALTGLAHAPAGTEATSTVTDLLRLAGWHLDEPALEGMRAVHSPVQIAGWLDAWCLGWAWFDWTRCSAWGWDGVVTGQRAFLRLLPDRRGAVVLLTNASNGRAMARDVLRSVARRLFDVEVPDLRLSPCTGPARALTGFAGVYVGPTTWSRSATRETTWSWWDGRAGPSRAP